MALGSVRDSLVKMRGNLDDYLALSFSEFTQARISTEGQGVMVGCGPYPMTAICFMLFDVACQAGWFHQLSHLLDDCSQQYNQEMAFELLIELPFERVSPRLQLTCLDLCSNAITCAQRIIQKLKMQENFHFECSNIFEYRSFQNFSFVHLAAMVAPKLPSIRHILSELERQKHSSRLIVRFVDPDDIRSLLYEPLSIKEVQEAFHEYPLINSWRVVSATERRQVKTSFLIAEHGDMPQGVCSNSIQSVVGVD